MSIQENSNRLNRGFPKVSVVMTTYNHAAFIQTAIESVLMQTGNFHLELIIGNDCSTDNTLSICKQYQELHPDIIHVVNHTHNIGLAANYQTLFSICTGEFVAILEGDDYWVDPQKLDKQISMMLLNEEVGLVHTAFQVLESNGSIRKSHLGVSTSSLEGNIHIPYFKGNVNIAALTVVFRKSLFDQYVDMDFCVKHRVWTIDFFTWVAIIRNSQVKFIQDRTAVYRRTAQAATSTRNADKYIHYYQTGLKMTLYYWEKYDELHAYFTEDELRIKAKIYLLEKLLLNGHVAVARTYNEVKIASYNAILYYAVKYTPFFLFYLVRDWMKQKLSSLKQAMLNG